jgi:hypothetical protein
MLEKIKINSQIKQRKQRGRYQGVALVKIFQDNKQIWHPPIFIKIDKKY